MIVTAGEFKDLKEQIRSAAYMDRPEDIFKQEFKDKLRTIDDEDLQNIRARLDDLRGVEYGIKKEN